MADVKLTGMFLNSITGNPRWGAVIVTPDLDPIVDAAEDIIYTGSAEVPLDDDGAMSVELPEGVYAARFAFRPGTGPDPIAITLSTATSTEIIEDDGAGGTVTRYEKDISDFF